MRVLIIIVLLLLTVSFLYHVGSYQRIVALENAPAPELVHTCQLFDSKNRRVCGFIEVGK